MNKTKVLKAVIAALEEDLRRQLAANETASAGATHGEAKAETKWDTCGLEQSYLARGHAQQFEALVRQVEDLRSFFLPRLAGKPIGLGALVEAEMGGEKMLFFLLDSGGGLELDIDGREVTVITSESPVGAALMGKNVGETYSFRAGMEGIVLNVE